MTTLRIVLVAALASTPLGLIGCSARFYREQADRDSYSIIQDRQAELLGHSYPFDIEPALPYEQELQRRSYDPHAADGAPTVYSAAPNWSAVATGNRGTAEEEVVSPVAASPSAPGTVVQPAVATFSSGLGLGEGPGEPPRPRQMSILFAARSAQPPIGSLLTDEPPTSAGAPPTADIQPGAVGPTTRPELPAPLEVPPIQSAQNLFVEPGRWPETVKPIDLLAALEIAAANNRPYQSAKEAVYRSALTLTERRYAFESQFFGTVDSTLRQPSQQTRTGQIDSSLGFTRSFTTGGAMALSISNTLFEVFTDPTGKRASSALNLALSQPLLRGAGYRVAAEPLVQADRNVTYAIRTFERTKRELAVSIATEFYRVLQQGDQVFNERNNYANLIRARQRTEALADAGRLPPFQVDQARQDELRARSRWITAVQRYNEVVDGFRRTLGLPTDWQVVPDPGSLASLFRHGLGFRPPSAEAAIQAALANRLDLRTAADQVDDADRRVHVAADALQAGLDLRGSIAVPSSPEFNRPTDFRFEHGVYSISALIDLPLDRLSERNVYRAALIDLNVSRRNLTEQVDRISQQVRNSIRGLALAENSYDIQERAVELARRRVESTDLLLQAGRASTRDLLESQAALVEAQNALTRALVDYHITRLELFRDMETLHVEPAGLTYHDPTTDR